MVYFVEPTLPLVSYYNLVSLHPINYSFFLFLLLKRQIGVLLNYIGTTSLNHTSKYFCTMSHQVVNRLNAFYQIAQLSLVN